MAKQFPWERDDETLAELAWDLFIEQLMSQRPDRNVSDPHEKKTRGAKAEYEQDD